MTTSHFLLTFGTDTGKTRTIRINNPIQNATNIQVRSAMNAMIGTGIIVGSSGTISAPRRGQFVRKTVETIDLP